MVNFSFLIIIFPFETDHYSFNFPLTAVIQLPEAAMSGCTLDLKGELTFSVAID